MKHEELTRVTPSSDLTLLLLTEQELEVMLASARAEAGARVEYAQAASRAAGEQLESELASAEARFQEEVEGERARRAGEVLAEARRQTAEYDGVPADRIDATAERALSRLLAGMSE